MKLISFINIKNSFNSLLFKEDTKMNYFIKNYSILAISETIKDGYVLSKKQDYKLRMMLKANIIKIEDFENLIKNKIPEKYIYFVMFSVLKHKNLFNIEKIFNLDKYPFVQDWILKQTPQKLSKNFFNFWIEDLSFRKENFRVLTDKNESISILNDFLRNLSDFSNENKNELIKYTNVFFESKNLNKPIFNQFSHDLNNNEELDSKKKNMDYILFELKNNSELEIYEQLILIRDKFNTLISEVGDIDIIKKHSLLKLYNNYLNESLNQYLDIKKELRDKTIDLKNPQEIVLENINEVNIVIESFLKLKNENKLMDLTSQHGYFSQLRKQW